MCSFIWWMCVTVDACTSCLCCDRLHCHPCWISLWNSVTSLTAFLKHLEWWWFSIKFNLFFCYFTISSFNVQLHFKSFQSWALNNTSIYFSVSHNFHNCTRSNWLFSTDFFNAFYYNWHFNFPHHFRFSCYFSSVFSFWLTLQTLAVRISSVSNVLVV